MGRENEAVDRKIGAAERAERRRVRVEDGTKARETPKARVGDQKRLGVLDKYVLTLKISCPSQGMVAQTS